ncbi:hypothetical protein C8Q75DRAFT_833280 [Abortiporus biennis]|nr:hypothetical protein C8Q75DRAFT_833280 [Abortiporus biennis]
MSSNTTGPGGIEFTPQEIYDLYNRLQIENYCILASSVLLFFDTILTFPKEVQRIWRRRFTGATFIYALTRYVNVAERITLVVSLFVQPALGNDAPCVPVLRIDDILNDLNLAAVGAFTALRLFGIYGMAWSLLMLIVIIWAARITLTVYTQVSYTPVSFGPPLWGCGGAFNISDDLLYRFDTISNALMLASDVLLIVLTWVKTWSVRRSSAKFGFKTPLATLLLRDGTVYFVIILVIQIFAIISSQVGSGFILWDVWTYFAQILIVIFLCRFMLNLRGVNLGSTIQDESQLATSQNNTLTRLSDLHFATNMVGNLAAPLASVGTFRTGTSSGSSDRNGYDEVDDGLEDESIEMEFTKDPFIAGLEPTHDVRNDHAKPEEVT